jgi:UDP-N-acetylmuramoyl-L-alanyl-D-glutamate--2,6-diaminopimelate ligase
VFSLHHQISLEPLSGPELDELSRREAVCQNLPTSNLVRPTPPPFAWAAPIRTLGITGTNGKSSTTHLAGAILECCGRKVLVESTLGYFFEKRRLDVPRTIRGFLTALKFAADSGCVDAVVETTSAALARGYAKLWRYDHAIFTNLTQEHIEAHGSWEHYLASKAQLFVHLGPGSTAVFNAADPASALLNAVTPPDVVRSHYLGCQKGDYPTSPLLRAAHVEIDIDGTSIELAPGPTADLLGKNLRIRQIGEVFAENALAASLGALSMGATPNAVRTGLSNCPPIPGRFEIISRCPIVAIDYAHTPDAIARTCRTARQLAAGGRVLLVFGAGGGSSTIKREGLGRAAGFLADLVYITSDNPRQEDPEDISRSVAIGAHKGGRARVLVQIDRAQAIRMALEEAGNSDVVVVAGKGHEKTQLIGNTERSFSDHEEVQRCLGLPQIAAPP